MAIYKLTTKYQRDLEKDSAPFADYPRPSMVRDSYTSLNGKWEFGVSKDKDAPVYDSEILLPYPPESALSGLEISVAKDDYMHYRRAVKDYSRAEGERVILHFGAIDQEAYIYVNGVIVGERLGGYIPFEFDITDYIGEGDFVISVVVRDALDKKYPYGKQTDKRHGMWYTPVSGIWQSVWLENVTNEHICKLKYTQIDNGVHLSVIGGEDHKKIIIDEKWEIEFDGEGVDILPESPKFWSPEEPNIYTVELISGRDKVKSYFAIRKIDIREMGGVKRICLNGKPYVFNGLLDQGYFPDGLFLPASSRGYIDDIKTAKALGFNMLRKHIKIEPEIFYYYCDTLGMAVFQDMINNSDYSFLRDTALPTIGLQRLGDKRLHRNPESREIFLRTMKETVETLYNHPSIVYWTIFNEGWGQFDADSAYDIMKELDSSRIIDATSGWFRRTKSDVDSRHIYFKALKPKGLDGRPLVISEFGGYSLRIDGHLFGDDNYGYKLFSTKEEFEDAIIKLYRDEVLPLARAGACAFVYTQVSDVEDETNGFLTYDREVVKVDVARVNTAISACSGDIFSK